MRKICIATGTRAEYGLLKSVMSAVKNSHQAQLSVLVTGTHLSREHGQTENEIIKDGFDISYRLPILASGDGPSAVCSSLGNLFNGVSEALSALRPDILVLLGDRYESFGLSAAALIHGIPVAHIHGGELTYGAIDDAFRHSMTKIAHWHFTAAEEYRNRVIQLGEDPLRVFNVGAMANDSIANMQALNRIELEKSLGMKLESPLILGTFHPETQNPGQAEAQVQSILEAVAQNKPGSVIWTKANADAEGKLVNSTIEKFIKAHPELNIRLFDSLGQQRYLSVMKIADVVVGNSSSGLLEAPILKTPTVNVGERQGGRMSPSSVIQTTSDLVNIAKAISKALGQDFKNKVLETTHPYGDSGVAERIVKTLISQELPKGLAKSFIDIKL